jgi:cyanophycinase-like exopeptidase
VDDRSKPLVLIAGGRRSVARRGPDPLIREALHLANAERPSVAYIGAASGDSAMFRAMIAGQLRRAGAGEVKLAPLCGSRVNRAKAMRVVEESNIVFLSGGDVEEGMRVLREEEMDGFLEDQYRNGKPFFGMSAGSIMLARHWIRWADPDVETSGKLFPCLGLAPVCCDTHDEEDGWEELQALARLVPAGTACYGIASGAALVVNPDGSVRALGGEVHRFARRNKKVIRLNSLTQQA